MQAIQHPPSQRWSVEPISPCVDRGEVRLMTRTGLDWTGKYSAIDYA